MGREEAIKELKELEYYGRPFDNSETEDKKSKALFMAIEALEKLPCDPCLMSDKKLEECNDAISRSEAIRVASGYCHWANIPDELAKLPSVNPKPCDDAISRQAVKDLFCRICMESNLCYRSKETCEELRLFDTLPSVTSQQKTGRWIEVTDEETLTTRTYHYECSECGTHLKAVEKTRYCSECGALLLVDAKMEVEE